MPHQRQKRLEGKFRRRVLFPGMVVLALTAAICVAGLISARQGVDELSMEGQNFEAFRAIGRGLDELALAQETVGTCEMCGGILSMDRGWLDSQIGYKLFDLYHSHETYILDGNDEMGYGLAERRPAGPDVYAGVADSLAPLVDRVRGRTSLESNFNERLPGSGPAENSTVRTSVEALHSTDLALVRGKPAIVSVMQTVPLSNVDRLDGQNSPLLVSIRYMDSAFLAEVSRQNFLAEPRLRQEEPELASDERGLPVQTSSGKTIAYLVWKPMLPGDLLISSMLPWAGGGLVVLLLMAAALAAMLRRAMDSEDQQIWALEQAHIELQASEAQATHLAYHDALTGLPNRTLFCAHVEQDLNSLKDGEKLAIVVMDLDRFKHVNDCYGHQAGDDLIRQVAIRLTRIVGRPEDVARLGGDEFAVSLRSDEHPEGFEPILDCIHDALDEPYDVLGFCAHVGVSIGVVEAPECGTDCTDLMRMADIALYRAKGDGRDAYRFFTPSMDESVQLRSALESDLRSALQSDDQLQVHYQPQMDAETREIAGVEALLRWHHPERGMVSPELFIPVAEETGLIAQLGERVLRDACSFAREWPELSVSVNLSPVQLRDENFVPLVEDGLRKAGVSPDQIEFEVTEGVLLDENQTAREALKQLRANGFRVALDDFGTGYSSLSYLRQFQVDRIKIDKCFVQSLGKALDAEAIVTAVITLGHAMGLQVTAEGVETEEQSEFLRRAGCNELQGYLFSKAVPADEIQVEREGRKRKRAGRGWRQAQGLLRA